jgi:hypothetical protein
MPGLLRTQSPGDGELYVRARISELIYAVSSPRITDSPLSSSPLSVADRWRGKGHETVAWYLEEYIEECLACLAFPESHCRCIRITNSLDRFNRKLMRPMRVVRIFPIGKRVCGWLMRGRSNTRRSG